MKRTLFLHLPIALLLLSCGGKIQKSLDELKTELAPKKEYSVILEDIDERGTFSKEYFHKYKVVHSKDDSTTEITYTHYTTDWVPVSLSLYNKHKNDLGMTILTKGLDGEVVENVHPAGYQYIGNKRYGRWRDDRSGSRFWEWYGKYHLFSTLFGWHSPVRYRDYNHYRTNYYSKGRPYYGTNQQYGTNGSFTKKTNPTFYQRKQQSVLAKKNRFSDKVNSRKGRSGMSRVRSRSSRSGK